MLKSYPPDIRLAHLIETYWTFEGMIEAPYTHRVLPDGCVDIIFDFGNNSGNRRYASGEPDLVGTMTSLLEVSYRTGGVQMMGITFAPAGITAFTRMPVFEFTNQNVRLPLSETLLDKGFYERLPEMGGMQERIAYLDRYFLEHLHRLYVPDGQISRAVSLIRTNNGQSSVAHIAREVCLCERHFERKFKLAVGISPKIFSNVMRFRFARRYVRSRTEEGLFAASISCGYHDLPHMNKDFRRFGHASPSELMV